MVEYRYDGFGNPSIIDIDKTTKSQLLINNNPFIYKGYYYDTETSLFFCNSRYYDPEIGRWISADDIDYLDPESINGLNLYSYCFNNPIMFIDDNGNYPSPVSAIGNVLQGFLEGMGRYLKSSTKGMSLTMQQAKKIARKMGHTQSARAIIRGRKDDIAQSLKMSNTFKSIAKWTGRALLAIDIGSSWVNNYNSGSSSWITDSIVDTGYSLLKYGAGSLIFAGCMLIPGVGWLVGIGLCIGTDYLLDYLIEGEVLDNIKKWASNLGNDISKGWNQFWSFNWA